MILHLGVYDIPYVDDSKPKPKKARKGKHRIGPHPAHAAKYKGITTGEVAQILEDKYHVMEVFYHQHEQDVASDLEKSLSGTLESLLLGAPSTIDPFGTATSEIEDRFKQFLSTKEMETLGYPGVPTLAALEGVSHRFKHAYAKRPARPSFIDTGLYQASFKSWID